VDSRSYVFIYPLATNADIPADFSQEIRNSPFEAGVFLPQDDSNRAPQYPARLLLFQEQTFCIIPHPASGQQTIEIPLRDLMQLETAYILLLGWMKFTTRDSVHEIIYNTRASQPLENFLALLRKRWLLDEPPSRNETPALIGDALDVKFRNLLHFETGTEEKAVLQFFQAAVKTDKRVLFFRRVNWLAGHLVLLTSANRILWITDHYKCYRELYAAINRSAPLRLLERCSLQVVEEQMHVAMLFQGGNTWRIPVRSAAEDASAFCRRLQERVSGLRAPQTAGKSSS
jgi:hypothetical protein